MKYHDPIGQDYAAFRYSLTSVLERVDLIPYIDGRGKVTIGVGYNIEDVAENREAVFDAMGIGRDEVSIRQQLTAAIDLATTDAGLISALNTIMADREQNIPGARTAFAFIDEQDVRSVFDALAHNYEATIDSRLNDIPESRERVALFTMAWNGPGLIGPKLRAAIGSGDRAEAFFEIRYGSNNSPPADLSKRDYVMSQVFGAFDNANPLSKDDVTVAESLSAFEMWTRHENAIKTYDTVYGRRMGIANGDLDTIGEPLIPFAQGTTTS